MKRNIFSYIKFLVPLLALSVSCKKDITSLNTNSKVATNVQGLTLFSNAEKAFADAMTTPNVNTNIFELISQYWAETTYPQESQYDLGNRNIPLNWWNTWYRDVIEDLDRSIMLMRQEQADPSLLPEQKIAYQNRIAIAQILKSYSFSVLVNTYGNIPYKEALMGSLNTTPVYDDQKTVYYALLDSVDAAITQLDPSGGSFDNADLIYGGDVAAWTKLANSIKLKMGITIADYDAAKSKSIVESAAPNVFTSNDDNALLKYTTTPPNVNPVWTNLVQSGRNDFVIANTFVDTLNARSDPRRQFYFTSVSGNYVGGIYGNGNKYSNFSHVSTKLREADYPAIIFDYAEVEFLLSEAAARGFNVGGTAAEHYINGVTASIEFWGGDATDAATYLAKPINTFDAVNWKKSLGVQTWIAYFTRGYDAWVNWRRLDYPQLNAPSLALTAIPVRYTYPATEPNLNKSNYDAAATAVGGDLVTTKVFWDKF